MRRILKLVVQMQQTTRRSVFMAEEEMRRVQVSCHAGLSLPLGNRSGIVTFCYHCSGNMRHVSASRELFHLTRIFFATANSYTPMVRMHGSWASGESAAP